MTYHWPNKTVPEFTDGELADAIEQNEADPDLVTQEIVQSCIREWERRRDLPQA